MNALSGEGIGLSRGITNRHELLRCAPRHTTCSQACDTESLRELHLGTEHALNERIAHDLGFVDRHQIFGSGGAPWNHVRPQVDLIIVVPEQGDVAREDITRVEKHASRFEVMGARLYIASAGNAFRRGRDHAKRPRHLTGRAVRCDEHASAEDSPVFAVDRPQSVRFELRFSKCGVLEEPGADFRRTPCNALVTDNALDGVAAGSDYAFRVFFRRIGIALAGRRDEASRGTVLDEPFLLQLLQDVHFFEQVEGRCAPGIPAVLVPWETRAIEQRNALALPVLHSRGKEVGSGGTRRAGTDYDHVKDVVATGFRLHGHVAFSFDRARGACGLARALRFSSLVHCPDRNEAGLDRQRIGFAQSVGDELGCGLCFTGCGRAREQVSVVREEDGRLKRPNVFTRSMVFVMLVAVLCACGSPNLPPAQRPLPSELPASERESSRNLPLDGASNFRDLGGYATSDGRQVKWGVLYRSGELGALSKDDLAYLKRLELRRVVDFRTVEERDAQPDRLPVQDPPLQQLWLPIAVKGATHREIREKMFSGGLEKTEMTQLLVEGNRHFVTDDSQVYGEFLRSLADSDNLPTLFHCTAGKDRAGFAAAIVLLSVGVPEKEVVRDFMLSNVYNAAWVEQKLWKARVFSLFRIDPEALRPLLGVEPAYIEAALDSMKKEYGSIDNYLREGLGVDDVVRQQLRNALLEP